MELGSEPQPRSLTCRAEPGEQRAPSTHLRKTTPPLTSLMQQGPSVQPSFGCCDSGQVTPVSQPPSPHAHLSGFSLCPHQASDNPATLLGPTDISECTSPGKSNTPRNNATVCKVQLEAGLSQATWKPAVLMLMQVP